MAVQSRMGGIQVPLFPSSNIHSPTTTAEQQDFMIVSLIHDWAVLDSVSKDQGQVEMFCAPGRTRGWARKKARGVSLFLEYRDICSRGHNLPRNSSHGIAPQHGP